MNPWTARVAVVVAVVALVAIRAPHGQRSRGVPVTRSRHGVLETVLLALAGVSFFVPLVWVVTPVFAFADYPLHPAAFGCGTALVVVGLWIFHRSHADLGTNWSITLEVRESHQLVCAGVYRRIRHPMYLALLLYSAGLALVLPNWVAGPAYFVATALLVVLRLAPEERMMLDEFGEDYAEYRARTSRLIPWLW